MADALDVHILIVVGPDLFYGSPVRLSGGRCVAAITAAVAMDSATS